jgi:CheY-like chemotaxis protein
LARVHDNHKEFVAQGKIFGTISLPLRMADIAHKLQLLTLPVSITVNLEKLKPITHIQNAKDLKILLVDDNQVNLKIGALMLKRLGVPPTTATNGEEALALALANDFDLILMDVQMPGMDGPQATKEIRRLIKKRMKIFALTADIAQYNLESALKDGMDGYITKPCNIVDLTKVINTTLNT